MEVTIRKYASAARDQGGINEVCCSSAFLGRPIDDIFVDTRWFADFMIAPYLTIEPEHTWVAVADGTVVGYLTGSLRKYFGPIRAQMVLMLISQLYRRYVLGEYDAHPRSAQFAEFVLTEALFQIPKHPADTPHFHFNVAKRFRRKGIGNRLRAEFEKTLRDKGFDRYYAEVMSSESTRPEGYFTGLGYEVFDTVPTTVFRSEVEDLNVLCVVRSLDRMERRR